MKSPLSESEFSTALRLVRKAREFTQEDFDEISSRVYISALERGAKQPTLPKVDELANHMGVHPLTLLVLAYCRKANEEEARQLCERALGEIVELIGRR